MKTVEMDARTLAYIRVTGPYGEGYDAVCNRLHQWAAPRALEGGEWIFIYHDNPQVTPPAQCRTDIGVTVPVGTQGTGEVETHHGSQPGRAALAGAHRRHSVCRAGVWQRPLFRALSLREQ